jgi:AcrR family transcriptional regulator
MDDAAMPGLRAAARVPRREVTRARILAAAREVFLTQGFAAATAEQIALAAGTRRSTLYNHFKDKHEILSAIADDYLEQVKRVVARLPGPRPSRRQIDAWIGEFAAFVLEERAPTLLLVHFSAALDTPPACVSFGERLMQSLAERLPAFAQALEPGQGAARARAIAVLRELGWALCHHAEHEGEDLSPQMLEVAADLFELLVQGWF